ncbi:MAG TPA: sugar phosphate nucleotidyltransferase [Coleofasciculaceae cyanobacterium]|jgi:glucose-1-phosphate thymidylyltransferase
MTSSHQTNNRQVIGLLPAGGQATRISPLPVSKELYPVGFRRVDEASSLRPKVVCHYLLEKMKLAGIDKAYFILRSGKWDIPAYFRDGELLKMNLGYLIMNLPFGVPYTLDQAYPFVQDSLVALGFPDILFEPDDAFVRLLARQATSQADVVLGLFPTNQPQKAGMVDFDTTGKVRLIIEKPRETDLRYMWGIAVWTPAFTQFMHEYVVVIESGKVRTDVDSQLPPKSEIPIGDVMQAAIYKGLRVEAEVFPEGTYLDIGTPDDLVRAVSHFATEASTGHL